MYVEEGVNRAMVVRFRILGPIEVAGSARVRALRIPLRAAALTVLAMEGNRPVPAGKLLTALWDEAPASAMANLRTHVACLREDLEGVGPGLSDRLTTVRGSGYRLQVGAGELDLTDFLHHASTARGSLKAGRTGTAHAQCQKALALWRGPFAAGLPHTRWLTAHAAGLAGVFVEVVEDLHTARLLLGDHTRLSHDVESLLADEPHRDRAWLVLMAVQQLSGDSARALSTFRRCHDHFARTLGIAPSASVVDLHQAVLDRDDVQVFDIVRREVMDVS